MSDARTDPPAAQDEPATTEEAAATGDAVTTAGATTTDAITPPSYPTFVVMDVVHPLFTLPSPSPILVLRERDSPYRPLEFPIGLPEAQSIALALERQRPPRPGAHDLLVAVLQAAGCDVVAVRLTGEREGTIHAELDLQGPRGHEVVDCRPTDGIAVALRLPVPAPVLCESTLLDREP